MDQVYVTIKIDNNYKIKKVSNFSDSEHLTYEDFVRSAIENTNVTADEFDCFLNAVGAEIDADIFINYISSFLFHPCFFLEVKKKTYINLDDSTGILKRMNAAIGPSVIVKSEGLKQFILRKAGGSQIISEYETKQNLTDNQRRRVISFSAAYAQDCFGFKPSKFEQIAVSQACLNIFPCLKSNSENELELLYNGECSGFLQTKLKNDRVKKRKLEKQFEGCESGTEKRPENIEEVNPSDIDKDLAALKSATLPEEIDLAKNKSK